MKFLNLFSFIFLASKAGNRFEVLDERERNE